MSSPMAQLAKELLNPKKRGAVNFVPLFSRLKDLSLHLPPKTQPIPFDGIVYVFINFYASSFNIFAASKTPVPRFSPESPELGYFKMPPSVTRKASRWREDWEVYEKLVRKLGHQPT